MESTFFILIELAGTIAFAISGIRMASAKRFDLFGAFVVGFVTAIGGGTTRDLMLNQPPFWMLDGIYVGVTALSLLLVWCAEKQLVRLNNTFFIFDTIGLALFVVVGMQKTLEAGYPFWVAIIMGTITGSFGGVIRDILINEVPLIFRKEIYALACVIGGLAYALCTRLGANIMVTQVVAAACVVVARIVAVRYHLHLPVLKGADEEDL